MNNLFMSVGAMKAGTTFLFNVLNQHAEIFFTPEKELHYFAHVHGLSPELYRPLLESRTRRQIPKILKFTRRREMRRQILSHDFRRHRLVSVMKGRFSHVRDADSLREIVRWYAEKYFADPIDQRWLDRIFEQAGSKYRADFSNYHALLGEDVWPEIRRNVDGKLRVIYVMRHPVDRLWSHYKFDRLQAGLPVNRETLDENMILSLLRKRETSSHSRYGDIVESLMRSLDHSEFLPLFMEEILEDPEKELAKIMAFLGFDAFQFKLDTSKKVNSSGELELPGPLRSVIKKSSEPQLRKLENLGFEIPPGYFS